MKTRRKVWVALIAGGGFAAVGWMVWAQTAEPQLVDLPPQWGTFYSLQKTNEPPFPFNPFPDLPLYALGGGVYVFDDRAVDYVALAQQALALRMVEAAALGMTLAELEASEGEGPLGCDYTPDDLWLELVGISNATVYLWVHSPATNAQYDLFNTTNLSPSVAGLNLTNWACLLRGGVGETNFAVTNLPVPESYYRLGTMQDSDGDGLTDAYEALVSHTLSGNPDTDGDGLSDGEEVWLGTNPLVDESAQSSGRINYQYDGAGWLRVVSGLWGESITLDAEGNVQQLP